MTKTSAQAVSAFLRRNGWLPVPSNREGVQVSRAPGGAHVSFCWDYDPTKAQEQCAEAVVFLEAAGYVVEHTGSDEIPAIYVTGRQS